jgi:hypothetical protein
MYCNQQRVKLTRSVTEHNPRGLICEVDCLVCHNDTRNQWYLISKLYVHLKVWREDSSLLYLKSHGRRLPDASSHTRQAHLLHIKTYIFAIKLTLLTDNPAAKWNWLKKRVFSHTLTVDIKKHGNRNTSQNHLTTLDAKTKHKLINYWYCYRQMTGETNKTYSGSRKMRQHLRGL